MATGDLGRARIEAMAGQIVSLAEKGDHAERALRAVSEGRPDLLKDLDADIALEDRILMIWQKDSKLLDGARNLAMGLHWRGGKLHYSFQIAR